VHIGVGGGTYDPDADAEKEKARREKEAHEMKLQATESRRLGSADQPDTGIRR